MTDARDNQYRPALVTAPGASLADLLEERGIRQNELAVRMDVTPKFINELIAGKVSISPTTALSLERALDVPADFWLARDARYQAQLARAAAEIDLQQQRNWLKELPLAHMHKFGWIGMPTTAAGQVAECLRYFGVASVAAWREQYEKRVLASAAFRTSTRVRHEAGAIAAWLRQGEIEAGLRECGPFDREKFRRALQKARALTRQGDPRVFVPMLQKVFAACGVVIAFVPAPKGCPVSGAVRWLTPEKALVQLSLRYKTNDHLWFTFFHECGHLLLHGKKMLFLERDGMTSVEENEANRFAADLLIPEEHLPDLRSLGASMENIESFASKIGIAAGIVVGRMQKEGMIPWSLCNDLRVRYEWGDADE